MDINQPDLFIIKGYIKKRDKNNYKALFFVIKETFKEEVTENYTFATFGKISTAFSEISTAPSQISTTPGEISAALGRISAAPGGISASSSQIFATFIY